QRHAISRASIWRRRCRVPVEDALSARDCGWGRERWDRKKPTQRSSPGLAVPGPGERPAHLPGPPRARTYTAVGGATVARFARLFATLLATIVGVLPATSGYAQPAPEGLWKPVDAGVVARRLFAADADSPKAWNRAGPAKYFELDRKKLATALDRIRFEAPG